MCVWLKDSTRKVLRALCGIVLVCVAVFLVIHFVEEKKEQDVYDRLQEEKKVEEKPKEQLEQPVTKAPEIPIDFAKLQETNPDIYAWIQIPGTKIDYPVLQNGFNDSFYLDHTADGQEGSIGKLQETNPDIYAWIQIPGTKIDYPVLQNGFNDSFYLDHTADGQEGSIGAIYSERQSAKDFSDFNTVLYGHNVPSGKMFRGLHQFEDLEYMKAHSEVIIYTPDAKRVYQIFAAVVYDDRHILNTYDFSLESHKQDYIDSLLHARNMGNSIREDVSVTTNDRILTMSTCIKTQRDKRFVVGAVLINEEKAESSSY